MDKSNTIFNTFTAYVDQLRNQECSQKEKISCFQHIAECIMSPALVANKNYATHCSTATNVLLLFCEDLDSVVRISAEENLNKIFRSLEKTRISRILMDLYGEIKRNGNQRSLRICLNLFSYYAPQIKEKHIRWYALRLLLCLQVIAQRKETLLCETHCEFVKSFAKYLQLSLTDSETCRLFEVFMGNIGAECAVKRRCSAQNCISLIEYSRNKSLMAKHGLNKVIESPHRCFCMKAHALQHIPKTLATLPLVGWTSSSCGWFMLSVCLHSCMLFVLKYRENKIYAFRHSCIIIHAKLIHTYMHTHIHSYDANLKE